MNRYYITKKLDEMKQHIFTIFLLHGIVCAHDAKLQFISLHACMQSRPDIGYVKCHDALPFHYKKLPITPYPSKLQPTDGQFAETFVVTIPGGIVCSDLGWINVDGTFIKDFLLQLQPFSEQRRVFLSRKIDEKPIVQIGGRVAVITTKMHDVFGHWFNDIVGRLIILQKSDIEYDWLYAPKYASYMKQTYELYGVPLEKIIDSVENQHIQAEMLIVPSVSMRRISCKSDPVYDIYPTTYYWPNWITQSVRSKFLPIAQNISKLKKHNFSKKVFISRKDAIVRKMLNEDEVFALFEKKGFKRYCMRDLSFLEQAALFYNADYIVSAHGSALANVIFCRPNTQIVEIFQYLYDASLYNLAQDMKCQYHCIKTTFKNNSVAAPSTVPINIIKNFITKEIK